MTRRGEKLMTSSLAGVLGVLFVLALAMQFGVGRGYHWDEPRSGDRDAVVAGTIDREPFHLPPESQFAVISERPLFNDDRRPAPETPAEDAGNTPPPSPLNISLTGTVIAGQPAVRLAMVRENGKTETIALKEGMPLPGDQGAWTLAQVKNRSAIFKSSAGEEVEVELAVTTAGQRPGVPPRPGAPPNRPPPATPLAAQSQELQQRIEERRRQMREAAERMKAQRQNGQHQQR